MKKRMLALLLAVVSILIIFAGCSNSSITEDMVVGTWTPSDIDYDADGEYSCMTIGGAYPWDGQEIISVELNNGGVGKLFFIDHSYERTGDIFTDAINGAREYYFDCTWEIDGEYLKIVSEKGNTFAFSYNDGNWNLTNGEGYLSK